MRIGENIEALELAMNLTGQSSDIYLALLWDSDGVTLVDTGTPGQLSAIRQQFENAGVDFESIHRIISTHQDIDHIGDLPDITRVRGGEMNETVGPRCRELSRARAGTPRLVVLPRCRIGGRPTSLLYGCPGNDDAVYEQD
jgi:glyoxylase-like metal-dependent hydrolase (beta-lactamase superfamily II)